MFWIKLKNGNLEKGNESNRDFANYASTKDVEAYAKKSDRDATKLLEEAEILSWIVTKNKKVARSSKSSPYFERFATKKEVEESGADVSTCELRDSRDPKKPKKEKEKSE